MKHIYEFGAFVMKVFEKGKWIWIKDGGKEDEYGEFFARFDYAGGGARIFLSVDGDYTLFINGKYVDSNQLGDFEHYKNYDEIDLEEHLVRGENRLCLLVWHFGKRSMRYRPAPAGAIFEIVSDGEVICLSSEQTLSRKSRCYHNGRCKNINGITGLGFAYDANNEDGCEQTGVGFSESVAVDKKCDFVHRVGQKLRLGAEKKPAWVKNYDGAHYLVDLGEETVGVPVLRFKSESKQKLLVAWGEHILDGGVRRQIGKRDFSFEYTAKPGENDYTNYMLRLGLRYMEIFAERPIELEYAGVRPQYYPTVRKKAKLENERDQQIYDLCVRTLELCMMQHYVDCLWREQCLYVLDSKNQMLCGYLAFEEGNAEYARANILLMASDTRDDGLLSITFPSGRDLAIPSFSLHFFSMVREYYEHTGDARTLKAVYPKLVSVMEAFVSNRENGLLKRFDGENRWNFYDWSDNLKGTLGKSEATEPDLVSNCLFIKALSDLKAICSTIGEEFSYDEALRDATRRVREAFFETESGLFTHLSGEKIYTALGNALAVTVGLCTHDEAKAICEAIQSGKTSGCSLSVKCFVYDALLATDANYQSAILEEIRKDYGFMLDSGATSTWEKITGAGGPGMAGSLCHGWSATPILYYHKFGMVNA